MNRKHEEEFEDPIKYCSYCKNHIMESETYKQKKGRFYHNFCWEQKNDNPEELKF